MLIQSLPVIVSARARHPTCTHSPFPFPKPNRFFISALGICIGLLIGGLAGCGGGGGDGGGTPPPAVPAQTIVSGSVQAPNGQVVFHRQGFGDFFEDLFLSSAYASLSGVSPVPNGTPVQLGRMSSAGAVTVLASTTVSGGRYIFNLTSFGLTITSDLVVRVVNSPVQMRAFVTGETVNLDPISESAVQVVLNHITAPPGTSLANFTTQELSDLVGAIDALTAANQSAAGLDINSTISSIKTAATNEPGIAAFLLSAGGPGQTNEGTGDIGNYVPLAQSSTWSFQGTDTTTGQTPIPYSNTATINGTNLVGGVVTTVLSETNSHNDGAEESYLTKDSRGLTYHGNNDSTDVVTAQLAPFLTLRFPFGTGSTFEEINKKGLNFGQDLDGDGTNEKADLLSIVTVKGFESVTVPAGTFSNCVKVERQATVTAIASSNGTRVSVQGTETIWLASGIGQVKHVSQIADQTVTEVLTSFMKVPGKVITLSANSDLIFDSVTQKIYASVRGNPGNITPIDPITGNAGSAIPVGIDPVKLARSDNGKFLYVGLDGEPAVQRVDLTTQIAGLKFSLGSDPFFGPFYVDDMEVLPGNPQSLAVSRKKKGFSPRHEGVAIYDDGVQRPTATPSHTGSNVIEFSAAANTLYGYTTESVPAGFRRMTVTQSGVSILDVTNDLINDLGDIEFEGGLIYSTGGTVINPQTLTAVGSFPGLPGIPFSVSVRPDSSIGRVFFLIQTALNRIDQTATIRSFDLNTRQFLGSEDIPGVTGDPGSLIRWGSKGLAFRTTSGQVFLIESAQLIP